MSPYNAAKQTRLAKFKAFDAWIVLAVKWAVLALLLMTVWHLTGCVTTTVRTASTGSTSGNIARLQSRPDAHAAVVAAPEWVRDATHTIIDLEAQLKEAKAAKQ